MSLRYPNEVTVKTQEEKVSDRLVRYQFQLDSIKKFFIVLERFEGKKVTKHIINAIKKEYPDSFDWIYLDDSCGMYHIKAKKGNLDISALIAYQGHGGRYGHENVVFMDNIRQFNFCYTLNEERIEKLLAGRKNISKMVDLRNKIIEKWKELEALAEQSEMTYDFDLEK